MICRRPRYFKGLGPARQYQAIATLSHFQEVFQKIIIPKTGSRRFSFGRGLLICCAVVVVVVVIGGGGGGVAAF